MASKAHVRDAQAAGGANGAWSLMECRAWLKRPGAGTPLAQLRGELGGGGDVLPWHRLTGSCSPWRADAANLSFQILIQIVDASSVITWDFDVCKGDIVFNIYHSKRSPQPPKKDSLGAHSITSPGGNNVQLIDRVWQLGRDYSMVESPLICKEGESVQVGSPEPALSLGFLSGAGSLRVLARLFDVSS